MIRTLMRRMPPTAGFLAWAALGACSSDTPGANQCAENSECDAGSICSEGSCRRLCTTQADCPANQVCLSSTCSAAQGGNLPRLDLLAGNDPSDTGRIGDGILVTGANLTGAVFELRDETNVARALTIRALDGSNAEVVLPVDIVSGDYLLVATNSAGSAQAPVTLLLPELSGTEIINRLNSGSTTGTLLVARLPVGTAAGTIAAGDHTHIGDTSLAADVRNYIETGGLSLSGALSVGGTLDASSATFDGAVKIGPSAATCDPSLAGTLRYDSGALDVCTANGWMNLQQPRDGSSQTRAARNCNTLHQQFPTLPDALYWLDPDGQGGAFQTYCDMTTNGGGWTLVATIAPNDGNSVGYGNEDFWTKEMSYGSLVNRFSNDFKSAAAYLVAGDHLMIQSTVSGAAGAILGWRRWPLLGAPRTFSSLFEPVGVPYAWGSRTRHACDTGASDAINAGTTDTDDAIIRQGTCLISDFSTVPGGAWPDMTRLTTTNATGDNIMGGFGTFIDGYASWNPAAPFMGLDHAGCSGASCTHATLCRAGADCLGDYCGGTYVTSLCGSVWNSRFYVR